MSAWSAYGACTAECGGGMQYRSRTVVTQPSPGQPACGALESSQPCNEQKCSTCLQGNVPATRTDAYVGWLSLWL